MSGLGEGSRKRIARYLVGCLSYCNVTDAFIRYLTRQQRVLRLAAAPPHSEEPGADPADAPTLTRARRQGRYQEIISLHAQGYSTRAIAALLHMSRTTAMHCIHAGCFPERRPNRPRDSILTPFAAYLRERGAAGCHNATQLWHELRAQGFAGGCARVATYVRPWRRRPPAIGQGSLDPAGAPAYGPRQTGWLLLRSSTTLTEAEQSYLTRLYHACPPVALAAALVEECAAIFRTRDVDGLYAWLHGVAISAISELRAVARGMWLDRAAVEGAVATDWSNGCVEGKVNKLKVTKRVMFGRATFDLLRQRVLHAS